MRACWAVTLLVLVQPSLASCATCTGTSVVPRVLALTHRHLRKSPSVRQPFAEISGSISFSSLWFPFPETVSNFVCHFKGSLHPMQRNAQRSPSSPDLKRVLRTVVSELARGLPYPSKSVRLCQQTRPEDNAWYSYRIGSAGSTSGPNERVQYHHACSKPAPKNSLQPRAIPQSLHQCVGDICALPAPCKRSITEEVN